MQPFKFVLHSDRTKLLNSTLALISDMAFNVDDDLGPAVLTRHDAPDVASKGAHKETAKQSTLDILNFKKPRKRAQVVIEDDDDDAIPVHIRRTPRALLRSMSPIDFEVACLDDDADLVPECLIPGSTSHHQSDSPTDYQMDHFSPPRLSSPRRLDEQINLVNKHVDDVTESKAPDHAPVVISTPNAGNLMVDATSTPRYRQNRKGWVVPHVPLMEIPQAPTFESILASMSYQTPIQAAFTSPRSSPSIADVSIAGCSVVNPLPITTIERTTMQYDLEPVSTAYQPITCISAEKLNKSPQFQNPPHPQQLQQPFLEVKVPSSSTPHIVSTQEMSTPIRKEQAERSDSLHRGDSLDLSESLFRDIWFDDDGNIESEHLQERQSNVEVFPTQPVLAHSITMISTPVTTPVLVHKPQMAETEQPTLPAPAAPVHVKTASSTQSSLKRRLSLSTSVSKHTSIEPKACSDEDDDVIIKPGQRRNQKNNAIFDTPTPASRPAPVDISGSVSPTPIKRRRQGKAVANVLASDDEEPSKQQDNDDDTDEDVVQPKRRKRGAVLSTQRMATVKRARAFLDVSAEVSGDFGSDSDDEAGDDDEDADDSFIDDGSQPTASQGPDASQGRNTSVAFYHAFMHDSPGLNEEDRRFLQRANKYSEYDTASSRDTSLLSHGNADDIDGTQAADVNPFSPRMDGEDISDMSQDDIESPRPQRAVKPKVLLKNVTPVFKQPARPAAVPTSPLVPHRTSRDPSNTPQLPVNFQSKPNDSKQNISSVANKTESKQQQPTVPIQATEADAIDAADYDDINLLSLLDDDFDDNEDVVIIDNAKGNPSIATPASARNSITTHAAKGSSAAVPCPSTSSSTTTFSLVAPQATTTKSPLALILDSNVVSFTQCVLHLRTTHKLLLHFAPLATCDFVLGSRTVIKRYTQKVLVDRMASSGLASLHTLKATYPRVVVIVELERDKHVYGPDRYHSNRTYEGALVAMARMRLTILFSESQEETAALVHGMVEEDAARGCGVPSTWSRSLPENDKVQ